MGEAGLDLCVSMCGDGTGSYYQADEIAVCLNCRQSDSLTTQWVLDRDPPPWSYLFSREAGTHNTTEHNFQPCSLKSIKRS